MDTQPDPVTLVRDTLALFASGDVEGCTGRLADDFRMNLAGLEQAMTGREAWRGNAEYVTNAFEDLRIDIDDIFAADDRVVVLATLTGTHVGEFLDVAATGRRVSWTSYEVYRVRGRTITEEWICSDLYSLVRQLEG